MEAQLTEPFTLRTYQRGGVRLWIDGEQRIFGWNEGRREIATDPIELVAGERVPVQLDFRTTSEKPACSLVWESYTQERERIPTEFLYPVSIEVATQPEVRPATDRIEAESFDDAAQVNLDQVHSGAISSRPGKPGWTGDGGYVGYRRIDFGAGVSAVRLRGRTRNAAPEIELRIDGPEGEAIGAVTGPEHTRPASGGAPEWAEWRGDIAGTAGVHDLYLVALDAGALTLDWFAFE